jgi:hypothetical protein
MHHRFKKVAGALAAAGLAAGLTLAGTGTARAAVVPASTWNEIFAPEINASGNIMCADNKRSTAQFDNLQLWHCHGYASDGAPQRWQFVYDGQWEGGSVPMYQIANVGSGLCIGLDPNRVNAGTIPGSNLVQESCASHLAEWRVEPATQSPDPNNQFMLENVYNDSFSHGYTMDANTFLDQNGTRLIAEPEDAFNSAQWFALG